jgi:chaperonin GroES
MLIPQGDRLVVQPVTQNLTRPSGLILPDVNTKEQACEGTVVTLGPGARKEDGTLAPFQVKVGDKIIYSRFAGSEIKYEGKDYMVISERDVYAVLK